MVSRLFLVAVMLLFAGCAGSPISGEAVSESPTPTSTATTETMTATETPTPTTTHSPTPTHTGTPTGPQNPWLSETVRVTVLNIDGQPDRNFSRPVKNAVNWWTKDRVEQYTEHSVSVEYVEAYRDADVIVRVVNETDCSDDKAIGCAPLINPDETDYGIATIQVVPDMNDLSVNVTTAHELGHVLGLTHTDEPTWLMAYGDHGSGSATNASDRSDPWPHNRELRVYSREYQTATKSVAAEYGDDVVVVNETWKADVTVKSGPPPEDVGKSVATTKGIDWDSDPEIELYESATIYLNGVDDEVWHISHWLEELLGDR